MVTGEYHKILKECRLEWRMWIDSDIWGWCWYCHFTFATLIHPEQAHKYFRRFLRLLNETIYGNHYYRKRLGVIYCRAFENQQRDALHYHVLFSGIPDNIRRMDFVYEWNKLTKGSARIYAYDENQKASGYMSKYITKEGDLEIDGNEFVLQKKVDTIQQSLSW
jgi:hypothetical protein